ncbi:ArnT family glycosyltransferase [Oryzicola mucosus]|uniref:Glycosyltransferase family 39 protein n=1 Tax=Oryzicola mucosus TaxID=2767425 RepID=A0A8J6U4F4_9HYPH|nr:glycosyltransferase family 39 protein [Oryzicola mucosus]MBD0414205.1 glycosyltransferase family 39 protein [Oryzicola mucosus]
MNKGVPIAVFLISFVKFFVVGFLIVPPWGNADEPAHYSYVMEFARGNFVPEHGVSLIDSAAVENQNGAPSKRKNYVLSHPPLYYVMMAPAGFLADVFSDSPVSILYSIRFLSALFAAVGVLFMYLTSRELALSLIGSWFCVVVALATPTFVALSGGISNDVGVFAFAAIGGYYLARFMKGGCRLDETLCILAFVAATLTKSTALPLLVGMVAFFAIQRLFCRGFSLRWIAGVSLVLTPIFLWHLYSFLKYGNWVRLGSLRTKHVLSSENFTIFDFFRASSVVERFIGSFHGHIWLRNDSKDLVMIYLSNGLSRDIFISAVLFMLLIVSLIYSIFIVKYKPIFIKYITVIISASFALFVYFYISNYSIAAPFLAGLIAFLGVFSILNSPIVFITDDALVKFSILTFSAFVLFCLVAIYNIYQVQLITGGIRATHGRYFYAIAPLLLISISGVIDRFRGNSLIFFILASMFLLAESFFWNDVAFPTYRAYEILSAS